MFAGCSGWVRRAAHVILFLTALALPGVSSGFIPTGSVTLAWNASTDPTVVGYKIYYGVATGTYTNSVDAGSTNSTTIAGLTTDSTYYFAATAYNSLNVESTYSTEASFAFVSPNLPPTLDPISNVVINESAGLQTVNLSGISTGSTNQTGPLTVTAFSSDPTIVSNPTVNYNSPNSTGSLTFAPVTNAFGQVTLTVMVDNGNTVSNTIIRSFTVTVNPVNVPPTLSPIANMVLNENAGLQTVTMAGISTGATNEIQPLTVTAVSSNPTLIPNPSVNYSSPNATGTLTFTPVTNAFGGATITVSVSDGQLTNSTTAQQFVVTVNQVVAGPPPVTTAIVYPNSGFRFVINKPVTNGDNFSYSLASAPTGAKIITRKGISALFWMPTSTQASSTNDINIALTDNNNATLSTNQVVRVTVLDYLLVAAGATNVQAGQPVTVPIYLSSSDNVTNLVFKMPWSASRFSSPSLSVAWAGVASNSLTIQNTNLVITIAAPTQPLQGSNLLAQLTLQTLTNQHSAFVGLPVAISSSLKPNGLTYSNNVSQAGEVALVADVPLTRALNTGTLNLYGKVGTQYQLQYCTNFIPNGTWYPLMTYTHTNVLQQASVGSPSSPIVYRLKQ